MTTPTLTCDHCESEIDTEKHPNCVIYDASGVVDVICEDCRQMVWERRNEREGACEALREAYMIKRGWA